MNKVILSLLGCSSSVAAVLVTGSIASPDTAKTIPYPEVMNLKRVPIFNARGIVPQTAIATKNLPTRAVNKQPIATAKPLPITVAAVSKPVVTVAPPAPIATDNLPTRAVNKQPVVPAKPLPITVEIVSQAVGEVGIEQQALDSLGYRNLAPNTMVLGYSSPSNYLRPMVHRSSEKLKAAES